MKNQVQNPFKISVDRNKKAYAKGEILINAPAEEVFKKIADINNWPQWQDSVKKVRLNGPLTEDSSFKWKANGMAIHSKLHTLKPCSAIGWTGNMWWIRAIHNWSFYSENGQCRVIVEESMSGFLSGWLKRTLESGIVQNLAELKAALA